jgi:hypothetical protein
MGSTSTHDSAPAWLFSFVDLAFLLLIAMTQLSSFEEERRQLGELVVPSLESDAPDLIDTDTAPAWQLLVHTPARSRRFELVSPPQAGVLLEEAQLRAELDRLRVAGADRPLIAPHPDSRSEDLLAAVGFVEELWPSRRNALVERVRASE